MTQPQLAQLLSAKRDEIVASFVHEVERGDLPPPGLSKSILADHIPTFLSEIVSELVWAAANEAQHGALQTSPTARQHGAQRWSLGYDLDALIREYGILHHCILSTARAAGTVITIDEIDVLAKRLHVGVAEAAIAYARFRDEQLDMQRSNLVFLGEAGELLASSLDYHSTLERLTSLLVPRFADWCAVHLEDTPADAMPIAHVDPSKVAVLREIFRGSTPEASSPFSHRDVMTTGAPRIQHDAGPERSESWAESAEQLALLREIGPCSWITVPLRNQAQVFGALTIASSSLTRRYDAADLVLASELARRAAVAIDNARLYQVSESERSRVEAATRAKDEFVAVVSHELRTPLNAIMGWIKLVRGGGLLEDKKAHGLEVIDRNANALQQLIADLLDISRVITGKLRLNPAQVDFANVVEMAIENARPAADARSIAIHADVDAPIVVRADGDRLQQVVWNLLANAVKFTPKGGQVRVGLRHVGSDVELTVSDTGQGIDPSFLPHVFEEFRQADSSSSRLHSGLGLGLSIAKRVTELHGGTISAHSEGEGKGATFVVRLPVSPLVSSTLGVRSVGTTAQSSEPPTMAQSLTGLRVLVVDDDDDARDLLGYMLESNGAEVRLAASAAEALEVHADHELDVIISDIGMPDDDGYSLIRSLRGMPSRARRSVPVVALTAFARQQDRTLALAEGFDEHLTKPVEPKLLLSVLLRLGSRSN